MENVELANNRISGTITVDGSRVLQIAVPYSDGWTAKVNGEAADIFRCGGMYMGIALDAGTYEIEMQYVTPGLKLGMIVSALALALTVALVIGGKINKNKKHGGKKQ